MKCQSLFCGKNTKNISKRRLLKLLSSMLSNEIVIWNKEQKWKRQLVSDKILSINVEIKSSQSNTKAKSYHI